MANDNPENNDAKSAYFKELFGKLKRTMKLNEKDALEFDKYWNMLWNISSEPKQQLMNHNLLIWCENNYVAKYVCDKMQIFLSLCKTNTREKYIIIDSKEDLDEFKNKFNDSLLKRVFVVFARKDAFEDSRAEFGDGLYYRGLPIHLTVNTTESQVVAERIIEKLHAIQPVKLNTEFEEAFIAYIETVYPKADLRRENMAGADQPFIDDAVQRVLREYTGQHMLGEEAGAECVPYYIKSIDEPTEEEAVSSDNLKEAEPLTEPENILQEQEIEEPIELTRTNELSEAEPEKENCVFENVLLLSMSTFPRSLKLNENMYKTEDGKQITGYGQLEPIPKLLKEKNLDLIVIMASKETLEEECVEMKGIKYKASPVALFEKNIAEEYQNSGQEICFKVIESGSQDAMQEMMNLFKMLKGCTHDMKFYLDIHGGPREDQLLMDAIIYLLKTEGIKPEATYTIHVDSPVSYIVTVNEMMQAFDLTAGINEFLYYGRSGSLEQIFKGQDELVVDAIREISSSISLCQMDKFEKDLKDLSKIIKNSKGQAIENYLQLFYETIESDYNQYGLLDEDGKISNLIRWCVSKEFYQQALTIIESQVPGSIREGRNRNGIWGYNYDDEIDISCDNFRTSKTVRTALYLSRAYSNKLWEKPDNYIFEALKKEAGLPDLKEELKAKIIETVHAYNGNHRLNDIINDETPGREEFYLQKKIDYNRDMRISPETNDIRKLKEELKDCRKKKSFVVPFKIFYKGNQPKLFGLFLQLHFTIKELRNRVNHASKDSIPELDTIKDELLLYADCLDAVLQDCAN